MGSADSAFPYLALNYPERMSWQAQTLDLVQLSRLDFEEIDLRRFPCYKLAKDTLAAAPEQRLFSTQLMKLLLQHFFRTN